MMKKIFIALFPAIIMLCLSTAICAADGGANGDPTKWLMDNPDRDSAYDIESIENNGTEGKHFKSKFLPAAGSAGIMHNARFRGYGRVYGIDVSAWQEKNINWEKVKKSGIKFAIIRVGYRTYGTGQLFEDKCFRRNIYEAYRNGIKVGAYIFSQAVTPAEGIAEAKYITEKLKPYKSKITMPVIIDVEFAGGKNGRLTKAKLSKAKQTVIALSFCGNAEKAGYTPMLYASTSFLNNRFDMSQFKYDVWVAQYYSRCQYTGPKNAVDPYSIWQYTSSARVNGIDGRVDKNVWYDYKGSTAVSLSRNLPAQINVSWAPAKNATRYYVKRNGKTIYRTTKTNFVDKNVEKGKHYTYTALPYQYGDAGLSSAGKVTTAMSFDAEVRNIKSSRDLPHKIRLSWSKTPYAQKYYVYRMNREGKYVFWMATTNNYCYNSGLGIRDIRYYKVRAKRNMQYGKVSNPIYAATSSRATVKVKTYLNLRSGPGTKYPIKKRLKNGTGVTVTSVKKSPWYYNKTSKNNNIYVGYVSKKYLR